MSLLRRSTRAETRRACAGFTLYEVLIAVSLLSLLSVATLSALRFGVVSWRKAGGVLTAASEVSAAQRYLRAAISSAYPRLEGDAGQAVEFAGTQTEMRFLGRPLVSFGPGVRAYLTIRVERDGGLQRIVSITRPELARDGAGQEAITETLIEGMTELRFSYLAVGENVWRNAWLNEPRLPALVRIEAKSVDGAVGAWPELVIAPQIEVDASCRYDKLTKYCQGRR